MLAVLSLITLAVLTFWSSTRGSRAHPPVTPPHRPLSYEPRQAVDSSGFFHVLDHVPPWKPDAALEQIGSIWRHLGEVYLERIDRGLGDADASENRRLFLFLERAMILEYQGESDRAYESLQRARSWIEESESRAERMLYTVIYFQGVAAFRRGENENCIMCRGESSCIFPIDPAAVHTIPTGSRLAIGHFTECLEKFPNDTEVRWLLNLAHMTLGEYPDKVAPRFLMKIDRFLAEENDIGRFRDIGHLVGVNRFNRSGGAIMEDFDNDGLLDLVVTSIDPNVHMAYYRNKGDGTFEERTEPAGLTDQLGGLYCVQTDYDNDGRMDIFIPRGAWFPHPIPPSLLRNPGDGSFRDVTRQAGLLDPAIAISASWADYDNDGLIDLFIPCERQPNRLYHNRGDGTFEEVAGRAGVQGVGEIFIGKGRCRLDRLR